MTITLAIERRVMFSGSQIGIKYHVWCIYSVILREISHKELDNSDIFTMGLDLNS